MAIFRRKKKEEGEKIGKGSLKAKKTEDGKVIVSGTIESTEQLAALLKDAQSGEGGKEEVEKEPDAVGAPGPDIDLKALEAMAAAEGGRGEETVKTGVIDSQKLAEFKKAVGNRPLLIIKALATKKVGYVLPQDHPSHLKPTVPTDAELEKFITASQSNPKKLAEVEGSLLGNISREQKSHPDDWEWAGRRARYQIARTNLNKTLNEMFGAQLPVVEHELTQEKLREHALQQRKK